MTLRGTIVLEGDKIFVKYTTTFENEPIAQTMFWRVANVVRSSYNPAWPANGDEVTSGLGQGGWRGPGYSVHFPGSQEAERVLREAVPCPPTRGKPSRWYQGHWQKLMAKGWVPA